MNQKKIREILHRTDYIRVSGSAEEKQAAEYLQELCREMSVKAWLEPFPVETAEIISASLTAGGRQIPGPAEKQHEYLPECHDLSG